MNSRVGGSKCWTARSAAILSLAAALGLFLGGWVQIHPAAGSSPVQPQAPQARVMCENDPALVGCWRMEEGTGTVIYDGGAEPSNDGTLLNSPGYSTPGKIGAWAIQFTYVNNEEQYAVIPTSPSLDLPDRYTISLWLYPYYSGNQNIVTKITGDKGYELYLTTTKVNFQINGDKDNKRVQSIYAYTPNTWFHLAVVFDGSQLIMFINGTLNSSKQTNVKILGNSSDLILGGKYPPNDKYYRGLMDDVRIYNYTLTPEQISTLASLTPPGDTTHPGAPQNLQVELVDQDMHLAWSPNSEVDVAGYNVYRSGVSPVTLSNPLNGTSLITDSQFTDLEPIIGNYNYYVVTAVDSSHNESAPSNEAATSPTAVTATDFAASRAGDTALLTWQTASEVGAYGFNLYRSASIDGQRELRGSLPALFPGQVSHPEHTYTFSDPLPPGEAWYYWLEVDGPGDWLGPAGPLALPYRVVLPLLVH